MTCDPAAARTCRLRRTQDGRFDGQASERNVRRPAHDRESQRLLQCSPSTVRLKPDTTYEEESPMANPLRSRKTVKAAQNPDAICIVPLHFPDYIARQASVLGPTAQLTYR